MHSLGLLKTLLLKNVKTFHDAALGLMLLFDVLSVSETQLLATQLLNSNGGRESMIAKFACVTRPKKIQVQ